MDIEGKKYREEGLDLINKYGEGYVTYKYRKLDSNEISEKLSYVKKMNQWDWVLSTGVHLDKLDIIVEKNLQKLEKIQKNNQHKTWGFFFILFLVLSLFSIFTSRKISFETGKITQFFKRAAFDKEKIDVEIFHIDDFKSLALYANEMIRSIHDK